MKSLDIRNKITPQFLMIIYSFHSILCLCISDALELEFHESSRDEFKIFRAEPSRAGRSEKRAESVLDF